MHPELYELKALVAGSLGPARRKEIDAHIAGCGECSRHYVMLCVGKSTPPSAEPRVATPQAASAAPAPRAVTAAAVNSGAPTLGDTIITLDGSADPSVEVYGIDAPLGGISPSVVSLPTPSPILPIEPPRRAQPAAAGNATTPAASANAPVRSAAPAAAARPVSPAQSVPAPMSRPAAAAPENAPAVRAAMPSPAPVVLPSPGFTPIPAPVAPLAQRLPLAELPKVSAATVPAMLPPASPPAPRRMTPPVLAQVSSSAAHGARTLLARITGAQAALVAAASGGAVRAPKSRKHLLIGGALAATLLVGLGGVAAYRAFQSSVASAASAAAAAAAKAVNDRQVTQAAPAVTAPAAPRTERVIVYRDRPVSRPDAAPASAAASPAPVTVDTRTMMDVKIPEVTAAVATEDNAAVLARSAEADMQRSARGTAERTKPKP